MAQRQTGCKCNPTLPFSYQNFAAFGHKIENLLTNIGATSSSWKSPRSVSRVFIGSSISFGWCSIFPLYHWYTSCTQKLRLELSKTWTHTTGRVHRYSCSETRTSLPPSDLRSTPKLKRLTFDTPALSTRVRSGGQAELPCQIRGTCPGCHSLRLVVFLRTMRSKMAATTLSMLIMQGCEG